MPVKIYVSKGRGGQKHIVGKVAPGRYAVINNYSSGSKKNISVHVSPKDTKADVYEFPDGIYTTLRKPGVKFIPLSYYNLKNLDATIRKGSRFEHPLATKSHRTGKLSFALLNSHRGARTTLNQGRHK